MSILTAGIYYNYNNTISSSKCCVSKPQEFSKIFVVQHICELTNRCVTVTVETVYGGKIISDTDIIKLFSIILRHSLPSNDG